MKRILITGGAGFIGSHVVREFVLKYPAYKIINLDALTYAGNLENLKDIEDLPNYHFIKADIDAGVAGEDVVIVVNGPKDLKENITVTVDKTVGPSGIRRK